MKLTRILYVIIVLCLTFTIFTYAPILNRYWYFYVLAIILAAINRAYDLRMVGSLIVYSIIVMFNVMVGDHIYQNYFIAIIEIASLFIPVSILLYLLRKNEIKASYLIVDLFLVMIMYTTVVSVVINEINPGIIRQSTMFFDDDDSGLLTSFYAMGLTNYFLPHALCILVPPLVLFVKDSSPIFRRLFYILSLLFVLTLVYISGSTTSLLLSFISLVLSFTLSSKNYVKKNYRILTWVLVLLSPILMFSELQLYLLKIVADLTGEASIYQDKVMEFESLVSKGDAGLDMMTRVDLLKKSLIEFASHPLFGTGSEVGGHNALIDRLATLGLIGIIPLFYYFKKVYVWARHFIDKRIMPFAVLSIFNGILMLFSKNMMCWEVLVVLFLIMPTMFYLKSTNKIKNNETNVSK